MKKQLVSVIGLGQVGRELAIAISEAGHGVTGIDINAVDDNIPGVTVSTDFALIKNSSFVIVCVQTPISDSGSPDLSFLINAVDKIKEHSDESALVVIESTVPIGTTSSIVEIINRRTAFSPERIDPGSGRKLKDVPKIVSSNDPGILQEAAEFYSTFIDNVIPCNNTDEAEAAKLLENSYRLVNISFINEFHNLMDHLRINTAKVVDLASTKPFGYQPFYPGLGAGGHCIPVDPVFLKSHEIDMPILTQAINTNDSGAIRNACRMISEHMHDDIENKNIVVLGLGYKSGVSDIRESKALSLIEELKGLGANVFGYDEIIKEIPGYELVNDFADMDLAIINYISNSFDMSLLSGINKFFVGRINYFYKGDDEIQ